jgi:hypothetical protein
VRDERALVGDVERASGGSDRGVHIAVIADALAGTLERGAKRGSERLGCRTDAAGVAPRDLERALALERGPRVLGQYGDAFTELRRVLARDDAHDTAHTRRRQRTGVVHTVDACAERRVQDRGDDNAVTCDIHAEALTSGRDPDDVVVRHPRAENPEVVHALERDLVGRLNCSGVGRQLAVVETPSRRRVNHDPVVRVAGRGVDFPASRRGGHERVPRGRADTPQYRPVRAHARASARELVAESLIERRLHDANLMPRHVELFGDDHRQRRLGACADLGVLRGDGDDAVGLDLDERTDLRGRCRPLCATPTDHTRVCGAGGVRDQRGDEESAGGRGTDADESSPTDVGSWDERIGSP